MYMYIQYSRERVVGGFRIYKLCMRNIAWDCHARPPYPSPDYANLLSCSCCCITRRSRVSANIIPRYGLYSATLYIHSVYAMSVDDGNLTSTCMRVVAFLATPPPLPLPHSPRMIARAHSASTRPSGNDLSHARNSGVPECTEQVREKEREQ